MLTYERLKYLLDYLPNDGCLVWKNEPHGNRKIGKKAGYINQQNGYHYIRIDNKSYKTHRVIWFYHYGYLPNKEIDHINHNRLDNRIDNLREVDRTTNNKNKSINKNNSSGYNGVFYHNKYKKFMARIGVNYKDIHLGYFINIEEAILARKEAEIKYGFHENHGKLKGEE